MIKVNNPQLDVLKQSNPLVYQAVKIVQDGHNDLAVALRIGKIQAPPAVKFKDVRAGGGVISVFLDTGEQEGLLHHAIEIADDIDFTTNVDTFEIASAKFMSHYVGTGLTRYVRVRTRFMQSQFSTYRNFGAVTT